jgi:hypothetical protein
MTETVLFSTAEPEHNFNLFDSSSRVGGGGQAPHHQFPGFGITAILDFFLLFFHTLTRTACMHTRKAVPESSYYPALPVQGGLVHHLFLRSVYGGSFSWLFSLIRLSVN